MQKKSFYDSCTTLLRRPIWAIIFINKGQLTNDRISSHKRASCTFDVSPEMLALTPPWEVEANPAVGGCKVTKGLGKIEGSQKGC